MGNRVGVVNAPQVIENSSHTSESGSTDPAAKRLIGACACTDRTCLFTLPVTVNFFSNSNARLSNFVIIVYLYVIRIILYIVIDTSPYRLRMILYIVIDTSPYRLGNNLHPNHWAKGRQNSDRRASMDAPPKKMRTGKFSKHSGKPISPTVSSLETILDRPEMGATKWNPRCSFPIEHGRQRVTATTPTGNADQEASSQGRQ